MDSERKPYYVLGIIDSYGAIHHQSLYFGDEFDKTHDSLWPMETHKRWRFDLNEWNLEKSTLSKGTMTIAEQEDVIAYVRKRYTPPYWVIEGEEWEALGRPREGAAYEKHRRKWDRFWAKKDRKRTA
jgi:hypothetical protein